MKTYTTVVLGPVDLKDPSMKKDLSALVLEDFLISENLIKGTERIIYIDGNLMVTLKDKRSLTTL